MRRRKGLPIHGWINLDKPVGPTSTQAIGRVRRITGAARVGHAGTLDPLASGVLPALRAALWIRRYVPEPIRHRAREIFLRCPGLVVTLADEPGAQARRSSSRSWTLPVTRQCPAIFSMTGPSASHSSALARFSPASVPPTRRSINGSSSTTRPTRCLRTFAHSSPGAGGSLPRALISMGSLEGFSMQAS